MGVVAATTVSDTNSTGQAQNVADAKQGRETIGVELYTVQQQLARFQVQLEQMHDVAEKNTGQRAQSDALKAQAKEMQAVVRNELRSLQLQGETCTTHALIINVWIISTMSKCLDVSHLLCR